MQRTFVRVKIVPSIFTPVFESALISVLLPNGAHVEMRVSEASFARVLKRWAHSCDDAPRQP
jgi:hypothetical protein